MHSHTTGDRVRVCAAWSRHLLTAGTVTEAFPSAVYVLLDGENKPRRFKPDEVERDQGAATFAAETPTPARAPASAFPGACLYGYAGACSCSGGVCLSRQRVDGWRPTLAASSEPAPWLVSLIGWAARAAFPEPKPSAPPATSGQTRRGSLTETMWSTAIGYWVAVASQAVIFPLFGIATSTSTSMAIAAYFTVISVARGYLVRRLFNRLWHK